MSTLNESIQPTNNRILILGDNPQVSEPLHRHLAVDGYDVKVATSAGALPTIWGEWSPDLILLDIGWSDPHGITTVNRLRARHAKRSMPIIYLAGVTDASCPPLQIERADDYIHKPVDLEELRQRMKRSLEIASQIRAPEAR